jgi:hypothetical protein
MSIAGILSSSFLQNQLNATSSPYQQDLQKLSQDLKSGNLSAAQSDFATLQKAFSQFPTNTAPVSTASASNPIAQAFNQLASDLQSGNVAAAQKDVSSIRQDFQGEVGIPTNSYHHHHHIGSKSSGGNSTEQNSLLQDLTPASPSPASSSPAGAQQAYATLQQELQQFAFGNGAESSALLTQPLVSLEA